MSDGNDRTILQVESMGRSFKTDNVYVDNSSTVVTESYLVSAAVVKVVMVFVYILKDA